MFDRFLNPAPTFYKWDRFWVGFLPAFVLPVISLLVLYLITWCNARFNYHEPFPWLIYWHSIQSATVFLRTASLCCMPNAVLFFFFIQRNYYNASRAVVFTTMLYVLAIVIKDLF
jgi:hypothetical protein